MEKLINYYFLKLNTPAVGRFFDFNITSSSKNFWFWVSENFELNEPAVLGFFRVFRINEHSLLGF
jgi:hypothetical protein